MVWSGTKGLEIVEILGIMSPQFVQTFWLPEAQDGALRVKQDTGVQLSEELEGDCCHWTRRQDRECVGKKSWGEFKILLQNRWPKNTMCKMWHAPHHLSLQFLPLMLVHPFKIGIWRRLLWWEKSPSLLPFGVSNGPEKSDCLCLGFAYICHGLYYYLSWIELAILKYYFLHVFFFVQLWGGMPCRFRCQDIRGSFETSQLEDQLSHTAWFACEAAEYKRSWYEGKPQLWQ